MLRNPLTHLFSSMLFLTLMLLFVIHFPQHHFLLASIIFGIYLLSYFAYHTKNETGYYLLFVLMGTFAEIVGTASGVWIYSNPQFVNIPLWLPFAWGAVGTFIHRMIISIKESHFKFHL